MREAKLLEVRSISLDEIDADNRLRPVTVSAVESLVTSVEQLGHMMDEIHVRKVRHQGGKLKLMAGVRRGCRGPAPAHWPHGGHRHRIRGKGLFITSFRRLSRDQARRDRTIRQLLRKGK